MVHHERYTRLNAVRASSCESQERGEIAKVGDLAHFLEAEFLAGYLQDKPDSWRQIPHLATEVLLRSVFQDEQISHIEASGSVPKIMADGVPSHFWDYGRYLGEEADRMRDVSDNEALSLVRSLSGDAAADLDIKILNSGHALGSIFNTLVREYGVNEDDIRLTDINGAESKSFSFVIPDHDEFRVDVNMGSVATNAQRQMMAISFIDVAADRRAFRVDIGELPRTARDVRDDGRQGDNSDRQDLVVAVLDVCTDEADSKYIRYVLPVDAIVVMAYPDVIVARSTEPSRLMEKFVRALRQGLLHEIDGIPDVPSDVNIGRLDMFYPDFTPRSLFELRSRVHSMILEGKQLTEGNKTLLERELALCLTIDPYRTIQALRDSGTYLFIPGLRHLTPVQWDRMLKSDHFLITPFRANERRRTLEQAGVERLLYKDGGITEQPHFDGVTRFICALYERDEGYFENPWSYYVQLWHEDVDQPEEQKLVWDSLILNSRKTILSRAEGTVVKDHLSRLSSLESLKARASLTIPELTEEIYLHDRINGITLLHAIIGRFPDGLTPRELRRIYIDVAAAQKIEVDEDFSQAFLDLKLLGLVRTYDALRLTEHGDVEQVVRYTSRYSSTPRRVLRVLQQDEGFLSFIDLVREKRVDAPDELLDFIGSFGLTRYQIPDFFDSLRFLGITSMDVLSSIKEKDLRVLWERRSDPVTQDRITRTMENIQAIVYVSRMYEEVGSN